MSLRFLRTRRREDFSFFSLGGVRQDLRCRSRKARTGRCPPNFFSASLRKNLGRYPQYCSLNTLMKNDNARRRRFLSRPFFVLAGESWLIALQGAMIGTPTTGYNAFLKNIIQKLVIDITVLFRGKRLESWGASGE